MQNDIRSGSSKNQSKKSIKQFIGQQTFRRIIQLGVAGFFTYLIFMKAIAREDSVISVASAEAYCPFGGLVTLYKYITGGGTFISHAHLSNLVMLVAVLVVALLFRSAFCGWICPLGFFQDLSNGLSRFLQKRIPAFRKVIASIMQKGAQLAVLDRFLRYTKYLVLAWAVGGAAYFGTMVFRDYDPWAALLNIAEFSFTPGIIVLVVMIVASFFIERPWCRYACPLGAVSGLVGKLSPSYVKRDENLCISCKLCTKNCPMGLIVHDKLTVKSFNCNSCLECVDSCPVKGALEVKIGLPVIGK